MSLPFVSSAEKPMEEARAVAAAQELQKKPSALLPDLTKTRTGASSAQSHTYPDPEKAVDVPLISTAENNASKHGNIFYLAYGSNLSAETFLGRRHIRPISQINVVVPSLKLIFDLAGVPYAEPCFANSAYADVDAESSQDQRTLVQPAYHKDRWHKGLVGVAYELTKADYARVIASEGGGVAYQDLIVSCHPLEPGSQTVPSPPTTPSFEVHTLFAPSVPATGPGVPMPKPGDTRMRRYNSGYSQASARYMKLIMDGAREHNLPQEYRDFLATIRPYTITTLGQQLGRALATVVIFPIMMTIFGLSKMFSDKNGRVPPWLARIMELIFWAIWAAYDNVFYKLFGNGERTEDEGPDFDVLNDKA